MYIALNQPEFPAMKATIKLTPVKEEEMKVRNYQQKNFWNSKILVTVVLAWLAASIITTVIHMSW